MRHLHSVRSLAGVRSNFRLLEVPYHGVIAAANDWSRRIAAFVGRDLDHASMAGVVDARLYRNRAANGELPAGIPIAGVAK
jgi:hypothetical protein